MKLKGIIISFVVIAIVVIACIFNSVPKNKVMECSASITMIGSDADLKYVFNGKGSIAKEQNLYVKLYTTDVDLINEYQNIMSGNLECGGIEIHDDYISYNCFYDLVKVHYYEELEEDNGELKFETLKKEFENDNFVCVYK